MLAHLVLMSRRVPLASHFTGALSPTIANTQSGVSISGTAPYGALLNTGLTDARVFCQFFLTGFDGSARFSGGIWARGSTSGGNLRGYLLPNLNLNADGGGGYNGQTRYLTDNLGFSNRLNDPDITLPGVANDYRTQPINLECEIVGTACQARVWLASDAMPDWQVVDANISRTVAQTEYHWTTGEFGFVVSPGSATPTITLMTVTPITELS